MKKLITFLIVLLLSAGSSWGQVNFYTFASSAGAYTALGTETVLWSGSFDDQVSASITIPSFTVDGISYTTMYVSANGWLTLGAVAPSGYNPISGSGIYPVAISPFGNDLQQAGAGTPKVSYNTSDGGDIVVQWQDVRRFGSANSTHRLSFQARMNPVTGKIVIVYGGTIAASSGTATLEVGLRGTSNSVYNNRTTTTNWAATIAGTTNAATCTFSSTVLPATGQTYTWTPPPPCSGTPNPGNTLSSANPVCSGVNFNLSLQNFTPGTGVTYQWQSSPNGLAPWTNIGTSTPIHTTSQTAATHYRCEVTCAGNTGISTPVFETMNTWLYCYCLPTYSSGGSADYVTQVTLGTLSQATSGNVSPYYYDYTSTQNAIPDMIQGLNANLQLTFASDANQYNGVWIDFNQNGTFETSEFFTSNSNAGANGTANVVITVPGGATLGNTRMRIRGGDDAQPGNNQACGASNSIWGQAQDYLVNITPANSPVLTVDPISLDFGSIPSGSTSSEMSYSLSGNNLTPPTGNITITPPANFEVSLISGGPYSSSQITKGYTGSALAATTIYVVFKPTAPSTIYEGNIENAGGGAATVIVAVSGSSPCDLQTLPYCQYFPDASYPACWTEQLEGLITLSHWSMVNSNIAGGTAYEAEANFDPEQGETQADNDRLISPPLITTDLTSIHLSFRQMLNDYDAGINDVWIKVQSSSDGTTWTDEWTYAGGLGASIPAEMKEMFISNNLGGTTWIAWTLSGHTYDINYWYVDDVCISVPLLHDAKTLSIDDVPEVTAPGTIITPKATIKNIGTTSPETFNVTMTATGGYTSTVYGVTLNAGAQTQVTFADWTPALGYYTAEVCTQLTSDLDPANDCKSHFVKIFTVPSKQVYGYTAYTGPTGTNPAGPTTFALSSPGVLSSLSDQSTLNFVAGGTWANGIWYGNVYTDNTLITIDPVTGARTVIGDIGVGLNGLSYNLSDGIMYGVDATSLYTINLTTGLGTLVGSNTGIEMVNLAINAAGKAYSIDLINAVLGTVDLTTGLFTSIGSIGFSANYAQDMEFDRETGELYVAAQDYTSGWLAWANIATGNTLKIGDFEGGAEITGFAIPYTSGTNQWTGSISTDWNNNGNWSAGHVPYQTEQVIVPINPTGGRFPIVGNGIAASCFNVTLQSGAIITVQAGGTLNVINP
jgi:hypothetical protein